MDRLPAPQRQAAAAGTATSSTTTAPRYNTYRAFDASLDQQLLDIGMPGMDGYEACRRLRRQLGGSVGIVARTGRGHEKDKQAALEAGFDAHLTKPVRPSQAG